MPIKTEMRDENDTPTPIEGGARAMNGDGAQLMEVDARLVLTADGDQGPEDIEAAMMKVLEALAADATDVALDLVGSCNLERREIELEFTLEAKTGAEVHRCFSRVLEIIEREVPLAREVASETRAADREPEPALG